MIKHNNTVTADEERILCAVVTMFPTVFCPKWKRGSEASRALTMLTKASSCHAHLILNRVLGQMDRDASKRPEIEDAVKTILLSLNSRVTIRALDHALEMFSRDSQLRLMWTDLPRSARNDLVMFLAYLIKNKLISTIAEENGCE